MTDIDGNVYKTVAIGDQIWMAENLKVTHYRNGDEILQAAHGNLWAQVDWGAYCYYENDSSNVTIYGRLYNWYAINDSRNIAPEGWHVPSDEEWKQLEMYLGMSRSNADSTKLRGIDEGGKLKDKDTTYWASPNIGATNESGFTALPGGRRSSEGFFHDLGYIGNWWTITEYNIPFAWKRHIYSGNAGISRSYNSKKSGFNIRCIKD